MGLQPLYRTPHAKAHALTIDRISMDTALIFFELEVEMKNAQVKSLVVQIITQLTVSWSQMSGTPSSPPSPP